jgi:hypothetical protein
MAVEQDGYAYTYSNIGFANNPSKDALAYIYVDLSVLVTNGTAGLNKACFIYGQGPGGGIVDALGLH